MNERPAGEPRATEQRRADETEACCEDVLGHDLTPHDVELDVQTFSALSNDTRYETLRFLAAADGEVCACDLEEHLSVNQSTISRALSALYRAGLVKRRKDGRWRYYTTTPRTDALLDAIDDTREAVA